MKKREAQLARKVVERFGHREEVVRLPWAMNSPITLAKGRKMKQTNCFVSWPAKELELTGLSGREELQGKKNVEISVPVIHLASRKEIKRIIKEKGEKGIIDFLNSAIECV